MQTATTLEVLRSAVDLLRGKGKRLALWGVAFKANTDDVRFAPSLYFIERLRESGAHISAFDPAATETAKAALGSGAEDVRWARGAYDALEGADALIVCAEWREFRSPDFAKMKQLMRQPIVFDGRNLYSPNFMREAGFSYTGVGRSSGA